MPKSTRTPWERIKEALVDAGYDGKQDDAAKLLGIKQPSVSEWKSQGTAPSLDNAIVLARKLNVCTEWLLTERGPKRPGPPMEPAAQALWDAWGRVALEDRPKVVGYAEALARPSQRRVPRQA